MSRIWPLFNFLSILEKILDQSKTAIDRKWCKCPSCKICNITCLVKPDLTKRVGWHWHIVAIWPNLGYATHLHNSAISSLQCTIAQCACAWSLFSLCLCITSGKKQFVWTQHLFRTRSWNVLHKKTWHHLFYVYNQVPSISIFWHSILLVEIKTNNFSINLQNHVSVGVTILDL